MSQQIPTLPGFARAIRGERVEYGSAEPDVRTALLVRSRRAEDDIQWCTACLPKISGARRARFLWLFGLNTSPERRRFELRVDGRACLYFNNPLSTEPRDWSVRGGAGAELRFRATFVDRHDDLFGYAALELPRSFLVPGRRLRLQVVGESAESLVWYMTFTSAVRERISALPEPALVRTPAGPRQSLRLRLVHLSDGNEARVQAPDGKTFAWPLHFGANQKQLLLPPVNQPQEAELQVQIGAEIQRVPLVQRPVRPWRIDLVQHTHTDIGYTRPQTEILPEHLRFIDYALDFCDRTEDWPEAAQFRWTCEASWAVREYLRVRPAAQVERLRRRVAEGRIEVTGLMFNMSEILGEALCAGSLQPLRELWASGIEVATAMQNDVNGAAWCLADYLPDLGLRYLSMGEHIGF